jgi:hypothetical protein
MEVAMRTRFPVAMMALLLAPALADAHHSIEEIYDHGREVTLTGTVTRVEWVNPHVVFILEVPGEKAAKAWRMELDSPGILQRRGWSRQTLAAGQQIKVTGHPLKIGEPAAVAKTVVLPDGRKLTATTEGSWGWSPVPPAR